VTLATARALHFLTKYAVCFKTFEISISNYTVHLSATWQLYHHYISCKYKFNIRFICRQTSQHKCLLIMLSAYN